MQVAADRYTFVFSDNIWAGVSRDEVRATAELLRKHDLYHLPFAEHVYVRVNVGRYGDFREGNRHTSSAVDSVGMATEMLEVRVDAEDVVYSISPIPFLERDKERAKCRAAAQRLDVSARECSARGETERALYFNELAAEAHANIFLINRLGIVRSALPPEVSDPFLKGECADNIGLLRDILIVTLRSRRIRKSEAILRGPQRATSGPDRDSEVVTTVSLAPRGAGQDRGGSHASPRMHLRRGHEHSFRFGIGRSQVRAKFIDAIWVNADAEFEAVRTGYKIREDDDDDDDDD